MLPFETGSVNLIRDKRENSLERSFKFILICLENNSHQQPAADSSKFMSESWTKISGPAETFKDLD